LTRPDGFDFYSGTINYRDAIGSIVRVVDYDSADVGVCGRGIHASRNPNDCFVGANIPCAAFRIQGIGRITGDKQKTRYKAAKVIEEISDLDSLFGWKYSEAINPIHPFKIIPPKITEEHINLLKQWASVRDSVWDSVRDSVRDSVWVYVRDSVWDSVGAYLGSLFPNIKNWKSINHKKGEYPFQSPVDLWKQGLVVSFDRKLWRLHGGKNGKILWEGDRL